jgi:hypothetical protein
MVGVRFRVFFAVSLISAAAAAEPVPSPPSGVAPVPQGVQAQRPTVPSGNTPVPDDTGPEAGPPPKSTPGYWYGWQMMVLDAVPIALVGVTAGNIDSDTVGPALLGLPVFALGGPIIHLAHERPVAALGSLGLRVTVPLLFAAAAAGDGCHDCADPTGPALTWGAIGMAAVTMVDATFLGREKPKEEKPRAWYAITSISPAVDPVRKTAGVSMGGTF